MPGQAPWTGPGLPPATRPLSAVPHLPTVPPRTVRRSSLPDLVAAAALVAAVLLLDLRSLHLWWSHDDFFNLHFVTDHRPWEYCFDPRVWRLLPMRLLTPLLFLSLHLDLRLFGADPLAFHAHQLAAATLAFLAFYAALRLWLPPAPAALGTGLALAGAPTLSLVQLVMARHYLEGLLLAAVAVICFGRGLARQRRWWLYLSALCYLAACLAKEIYVPLVLLFPLAAPGGAGRRLRAAAPHLAVFALYLGWRLYMLGTLGGGNGWSVRAADLPRLAAALPLALAREIMGPAPLAGGLLLAALAAMAIAAAARGWRAATYLLLAIAAAAGPVLPASTEMQARYAFPLWLVLAAAAAFGLDRLAETGSAGRTVLVSSAGHTGSTGSTDRTAPAGPTDRTATAGPTGRTAPTDPTGRTAPVVPAGPAGLTGLTGRAITGRAVAGLLAVVALGAVVAVHRAAWAATGPALAREAIEDRALLAMVPGEYLRHPAGPPASLHELQWFRGACLRLPPGGGGWFRDDLFLCSLPPTARLLEYDAAGRRVRGLAAGAAPRLRAAYCTSIREDAPLSADLLLARGDLVWRLGPYSTGDYSLVVGGGQDAYPVPRAAGFQVPGLQAVTLRVHYASPAGWNTYSPELSLAAGSRPHVAFARRPRSR